jgi:UDP-N-acetylmuramoyl-tripeptide--D-alanyl-D-alanine ligase
VIEMGMNHEGEIDYLTKIARPTVALVNNAQRAHVGILGSLEAIARAKGEIYGGLPATGIAVVNADDAFAPSWKEINAAHRVVTFGLSGSGRAPSEGPRAFVTPTDAAAAALQVRGEHNLNALAGCAWLPRRDPVPRCRPSSRPLPACRDACSGVAPSGAVASTTPQRQSRIDEGCVRVLAEEHGRVFVMGDMGELGGSAAMHAEVDRSRGGHRRADGVEKRRHAVQARRARCIRRRRCSAPRSRATAGRLSS